MVFMPHGAAEAARCGMKAPKRTNERVLPRATDTVQRDGRQIACNNVGLRLTGPNPMQHGDETVRRSH
jgi:hypothetical protein